MTLFKNNGFFKETGISDKNEKKWEPVTATILIADFLEKKLPFSVAVYAKCLQAIEEQKKKAVHAWILKEHGVIQGAVVQNGPTVYPVFDDIVEKVEKIERLKRNDFKKIRMDTPFHVFHGKARDVEILERYAAGFGLHPIEYIDYDFMVSAAVPPAQNLYAGPAGLIIRQPGPSDINSLFPLQAGYEQEEVLTKHGKFDPAVCRMILERIVRHERILIAELGGRVVGKINTNAVTPSWFQIGGVYVHPLYRERGIATRMTAVFVQGLLDEGKQVSLFVKKDKPIARNMYGKIGFKADGDYKISYF
ncbi:MAG: GNAT family N-acetyltransferase [Treponema sp.]|jgi:GNAT superfamily N-acetyltransferase|nr:GNAT family N-acetyltransferase [Treponema sp.]